jgi:hypothetical protein
LIPRRLVVFVEGMGDRAAVPKLAGRLLHEMQGQDAVFIDPDAFRVGSLGHLVKDNCKEWHRFVGAAFRTRKDVAAILLVLDGDIERVPATWRPYVGRHGTTDFCARRVAAMLAAEARFVRAGEAFSLAVVFAMQEFEAWLVAGIETLRGTALAEMRGTIPDRVRVPTVEIESKRDAKGLLRDQVPQYQETLDQGLLAGKIDLSVVRTRCRSFRRLDSAIGQIVQAVRAGTTTVSPPLE